MSAIAEAEDGLPLPQRYWAILTIILGVLMAVIDGAIANVALPTIAKDLNATPSFSVWIVNGYQLAITISLLPLASLGDIIGYRRVYLAGLALFTVASLLCALSHTLLLLTLARIVQGFGAAGIMSVNTALVRFTHPRNRLGHGIGINALVVAVAAAVGPTLAAGILAVGNWPWLFAVNIPFGIVAVAVGRRALPHTPKAPHPFDWRGAVLSAVTFGLGIAAIDSAGHGEAPYLFISEFLVAVAACVVLVRRERQARSPLLPVDLLRIPHFHAFDLHLGGLFLRPDARLRGAAFLSAGPVRLFRRHHRASDHALADRGCDLGPDRGPAGRASSGGSAGRGRLVIFAAGLAALAMLPPHPSLIGIAWRMALAGIGFGLFQSPNNRTMIAAAPRERSGGASGMLGTARLLGQTIGAALVAMLLARDPEKRHKACADHRRGFCASGRGVERASAFAQGRRGRSSGAGAGGATRHRRVSRDPPQIRAMVA